MADVNTADHIRKLRELCDELELRNIQLENYAKNLIDQGWGVRPSDAEFNRSLLEYIQE